MRNVTLGSTGATVPVVSVGTWGVGGPQRVKRRPVGWSGQDDEASRAALIKAWELGLSHWDTADAYGHGHAERLIGELWATVPRDEIFLASKVGWEWGQTHGYEPVHMRRQLEGSFERLQTDTIDLFYLHHCDFGPEDRYLEGAIDLLREFRDAGKIRWIGLSDWDSAKVAHYAPSVEPDVVQVYRSVLNDEYQASGLAQWVEAAGAGACFFSPLQHGLLLGKLEGPVEFDKGDHRSRRPEFRDPDLLAHLRRCREAVTERLAGHPEAVLEALISAVVGDTASACALLGMRRPAHVEAAATVEARLTAEEIGWVRATYRAS